MLKVLNNGSSKRRVVFELDLFMFVILFDKYDDKYGVEVVCLSKYTQTGHCQ